MGEFERIGAASLAHLKLEACGRPGKGADDDTPALVITLSTDAFREAPIAHSPLPNSHHQRFSFQPLQG